MLLDPFEKKLHRPTSLVELADHQCWQVKIIGQKDERSVLLLTTKADASQRSRVMFFGPRAFQPDGLVASQALRLVDPSGFNDVKACVTLVAHDKAGALLVQTDQPCKIQMPAIHHGERTRLDWNLVEHFNLWKRGFRDGGPNGQIAFKRDQRVQLHGAGA